MAAQQKIRPHEEVVIAVVGDTKVGKTCILKHLNGDTDIKYDPTQKEICNDHIKIKNYTVPASANARIDRKEVEVTVTVKEHIG